MDKILISGIFGAIAGAAGFYVAQRIHGKQKGEDCYPLYSLTLFGIFHSALFYFRH